MTMGSNENNYIEIIDDTVTAEYRKQQRRGDRASAVLGGFFVCPIPACILGPILGSGIAIIVVFVLSVVGYIFLCHKIINKKFKRDGSEEKYSKREMKKDKLNELKDLLERVGPVTFSLCNGFILSPSKFKAIQFVPAYGVVSNPPVHAQALIRVSPDVEYFSKRDKKLILEAFNLSDEDEVIWFSKKNVALWTATSIVRGITFKNKNGEKMYFGHTKYSEFYNHRELLIEDEKCVIHIRDEQRPSNYNG